MKPFKVALPGSIEQASSLQQSFDVPFIAGGTDLLARIKEYITTPEMVVDLKRIGGLGEITSTDHGVRIGALVTMNDVATNLQVKEGFPALAETIGNAATPQIRNMATIGGNICQNHGAGICVTRGTAAPRMAAVVAGLERARTSFMRSSAIRSAR